jgi:hypothetical protein
VYWFSFLRAPSHDLCTQNGGATLQVGRSQVRFPMRSLNFSIDVILPAALLHWGCLSLQQECVPVILLRGAVRPAPHRHLCADCPEKVSQAYGPPRPANRYVCRNSILMYICTTIRVASPAHIKLLTCLSNTGKETEEARGGGRKGAKKQILADDT